MKKTWCKKNLSLFIVAFTVVFALNISVFGQGSINFPTNPPPPDFPQMVTVRKNTSATFTVHTFFDSYVTPLSYGILEQPKFGELNGNFPLVTYKPNSNYLGFDIFSYVVLNGSNSRTGRVSLNVIPPLPESVIRLQNAEIFADYQEPIVISNFSQTGADVILDGTASYSPDGDPLISFIWLDIGFLWSGGGFVFVSDLGNTPVITNSFSVGVHQVQLWVINNGGQSDSSAIFRVITPSEAIFAVQKALDNSPVHRNRLQPVHAHLNSAQRVLLQGNVRGCIAKLTNAKLLIDQRISSQDPVLANQFEHMINLILDKLK